MKIGLLSIIILGFIGGLFVAAAPFTGFCDGTITIKPDMSNIVFAGRMRIDYGFDNWLLRADIRIRNNIWDRLEFRANSNLGPIKLTNHLRFDPRRPAFSFLRTAAELKATSNTELRARFLLTRRGSGFAVIGHATADDFQFTGIAAFNLVLSRRIGGVPRWSTVRRVHELGFTGADFVLILPLIDLQQITLGLRIQAPKWEKISVSVKDIPLGFLSLVVDADVTYMIDEKRVEVIPKLVLTPAICFEPYLSLIEEDITIVGVRIEGLRLVTTLDAIRVRYAWDSRPTDSPHLVWARTAALPYWQMVELRYNAMPFTFTTKALWGVHLPGLFGVTRIDADLAVKIHPGYTVRTGLQIRESLHQITIGFRIDW